MTADERLRDLTRRLGFGDGITEPQADNDTIVRWVEEQVRDADEWRESQRWRDACHAAGHPDTEDCPEHDPALKLPLLLEVLAAIVHSPHAEQYRDEASRHVVPQPYADNRYIRLLDGIREVLRSAQ